ncbi:TonB family protein [Pleionea sediminis]|uniref:TonB family protein n=1 Tax=Pleionea sediminis TaxID=2569479 RepID=UPI001184B40D|nr:TonB family protein [Pleionea sediminis]
MKVTLLILLILFSISLRASEVLPCEDQVESDIKLIEFEFPRYPTDTVYDGDGIVTIQFLVDNEGHLIKYTIKSSEPPRLFDRSALRALKNSVFSKSNDKEIRCGIINYDFILE